MVKLDETLGRSPETTPNVFQPQEDWISSAYNHGWWRGLWLGLCVGAPLGAFFWMLGR